MNAMSANPGFGQYDAARRGLEKLMLEFEEASKPREEYSALYHQLIWFNEPLTSQQVSAFQKANTTSDGDWQKWDEFPGGNPCGRFYGIEENCEPFIRKAKRGIEILTTISRLRQTKGVVLPGDLVLELPEFGGHLAWVYLLHDTARAFSTAMLNAEPGNWACTGQLNYQEDTTWETNSEGISFPVHPAYEKLSCNVFKASAEAISLWLDPDDAECVGEIFGEPTIYLPPEPEGNGPFPPNKFCLWGKPYEFSPKPWLLLECLWMNLPNQVRIEDAVKYVYGGADECDDEKRFKSSALKKLQSELGNQNCPAVVRSKKSRDTLFITLEIFSRPLPTNSIVEPEAGPVIGQD